MSTPPQPSGGLIPGAGTLTGTNQLQSSVDSLTTAVNNLSTRIGSLNMGGGTTGMQQGGGGAGGTRPFPRPYNPFNNNPNAPGIGGGGQGGSANVRTPTPFGAAGIAAVASSLTSFGQGQMQQQLTLNQYATISQLGMNSSSNGGYNTMMRQAVGMNGQNLNMIASSPMDAIAAASQLQQVAGASRINSTSLGRAGLGASAAFGLTNPTLSAQTSAQLAGGLYSPSFSLRMMQMGYNTTPRKMGQPGGTNSLASVSQGIIQGLFNKPSIAPAKLMGNLTGGSTGQYELQSLLQGTGISAGQMTPVLEGYNKLFQKGMNATQAQALFTQAASGNRATATAAQKKLAGYGVTTATNDIQRLKDNQAIVTGRDSTYNKGFDAALDQSTTLLQHFNSALSSILDKTGLGSAIGYGSGIGGVLSGTSHATSMLGTAGGLMALTRLIGGPGAIGAAGSAIGGAASSAAGAVGGAASSVGSGIAGVAGGGALAAGGAAAGIGSALAGLVLLGNAVKVRAGQPGGILGGVNINKDPAFTGRFGPTSTTAGLGGGSTSASTTSSPSGTGQNKPVGGSSSNGAANAAVGAARTQLGVPYVYGEEKVGVGFDCSSLVQWAYKQAGVSLPRTSEDQWSFLSKKAIGLNQVQEGDIVFSAGSGGTASSPGHEALMISKNQIIEAPHTGLDVRIRGYDPREWSHAGRPSGRGGGVMAGGGGSPGNGTGGATGANSGGPVGNMGMSIGGSYGSTSELDAITGALSGGGGGGGQNGNFAAAGSGSGTGGPGASTTGGGKGIAGLAGNKKILNSWAAKYGWGSGAQWTALNTLEMHEAGYNNMAQNPTSTAFGMGQFLDSTWSSVGGHKTSDPNMQSEYMMKYIKERYGSPEKAWSQYYQHPGGVGWYGTGGVTLPGFSIVGDRGPELMQTGGGNKIMSNAQTMNLLKGISAQPQQAPWNLQAGQPTGGSQHAAGATHFNFNKGSIAITMPAGSDASAAGREVAAQILKLLDNETVHHTIRVGDKD
jgi:cell wall-associated NlpC family hydrolase